MNQNTTTEQPASLIESEHPNSEVLFAAKIVNREILNAEENLELMRISHQKVTVPPLDSMQLTEHGLFNSKTNDFIYENPLTDLYFTWKLHTNDTA